MTPRYRSTPAAKQLRIEDYHYAVTSFHEVKVLLQANYNTRPEERVPEDKLPAAGVGSMWSYLSHKLHGKAPCRYSLVPMPITSTGVASCRSFLRHHIEKASGYYFKEDRPLGVPTTPRSRFAITRVRRGYSASTTKWERWKWVTPGGCSERCWSASTTPRRTPDGSALTFYLKKTTFFKCHYFSLTVEGEGTTSRDSGQRDATGRFVRRWDYNISSSSDEVPGTRRDSSGPPRSTTTFSRIGNAMVSPTTSFRHRFAPFKKEGTCAAATASAYATPMVSTSSY